MTANTSTDRTVEDLVGCTRSVVGLLTQWTRGLSWILLVCAFSLWVGSGVRAQSAGGADEGASGSGELSFFAAEAKAIAAAVDRVGEAVVRIEVVGVSETPGGEVAADAPSAGTVIDADGWILASSLVAERPAASILVVLQDGRRLPAEVVARDFGRELVVLKVEAGQPLPALDLQAPNAIRVGDYAIAVGRIRAEGPAARSVGIVSALSRLNGRAMQTDARISPPFYGGPLVNIAGQVMGIVVPAMPEAGGTGDKAGWYDAGIAFVAPLEQIRTRLETLKSGEDVRPGVLGVVMGSRDPLAEGTRVAAVRVGSPAGQAGIEAGDEVLALNGQMVRRHAEIKEILGPLDAGVEVKIRIKRGDEERDVTAKLVAEIPPFDPQAFGVLLEELVASDQATEANAGTQLGALQVRAIYEGSPAAASGIKVGDRLVRFGEVPITELEDFRKRVMTMPNGESQTLVVLRDGAEVTLNWSSRSTAEQWPMQAPPLPAMASSAWQVNELQLPDVENKAAMLAPEDGQNAGPLGVMVVFAEPGNEDIQGSLELWTEAAKSERVIVAMIGASDTERWSPAEAELASRVVAMIAKRFTIQPYAVGVSGDGAGGTMAIIAAFSDTSTFSGFAVRANVKPPAVRLRENDPSSPLHVLVQRVGEPLPGWAETLKQAGYAVVEQTPDRQNQLRFVWLLARI